MTDITGQNAIPVYAVNRVGESPQIQIVRHTVVSVGSVSTLALAGSGYRKHVLFINDSDETIYLKLGAVAITGTGIRLNANGGSYEMSIGSFNLWQGDVNAICASGGKNLLVTDGLYE